MRTFSRWRRSVRLTDLISKPSWPATKAMRPQSGYSDGGGVRRGPFALCAINGKAWLLAGVVLHGCSFTLVFITAQIYLDQRVEVAWRARAQALMSLMNSGVGNLIGYLGTGWWFAACARPAARPAA